MLIALTLSGPCLAADAAQGLQFHFDYSMARIASKAVGSGDFDAATNAQICAQPAAAAIIRKLRLSDCGALIDHLRALRKSDRMSRAAQLLAPELAKRDEGKYAPLAADVAHQLAAYVPASFSATLKVHFIFGSYSEGFAFDDTPDDVYVNLALFSQASTQELAETVAHELFHAVQAHVMRPETLPTAPGAVAETGPVWLNHLLANLEQEGTAELFTHPVADRPATVHSAHRKEGIERNAQRVYSLVTMFETLGWRMLLVPPSDENAYDRIYGLMFYNDFDATAYDLGWLMATTIEKKDGKAAIFALFGEKPSRFIQRYQTIAVADGNLPVFSDDFMQKVDAL